MKETEGLCFSFANLGFSEWNDIPAELLIGILCLADDRTVVVASGVCRGWRDSVHRGITRLSLSWCNKNMNSLVISLVPKFTRLEKLILRQTATPQLEDDAVEAISSHCRELAELDLSKSFNLRDRSLFALSRRGRNLVVLNVSGCSEFGDAALGRLLGSCRNLRSLNLCGCGKAATDEALKVIGSNCRELQSLNLGWCDRVGDEGVKSLADGCLDLRAIDLCGCILITGI
ncbi:hypothetical protein M569_05792 [Genlisea aurea]|uniref:F-box domain-containing protein n=1 Tax=Genlisea aurea TaxID=192259 RepID=S8CVJ7_9LAMI|nr:hypothetical protein M569_05792 [Genlisea aurea]